MFAFVPLAPQAAGAASYNLHPQCKLQRYTGQGWQPAEPSSLRGRIRDPLSHRGKRTLFQISGQWYAVSRDCLTENRIDPLTSRREGVSSLGGSPGQHRGDLGEWSFDLSAGLGLLLGSRFDGRSETTGAYTITSAAATGGLYLAIGGMYRFSEDLRLRYFVTRQTTVQDGAFSGSVTGKIRYENDFYHFGVGLVKRWGKNRLRPYAEIDAGYTLDSALWTLSEFSGIFSGLNGQVDVNAGGVFAGARAGAEWEFSSQWSAYGELIFHHAFLGQPKVHASTTSLYTAGLTFESQPMSRALAAVGARYAF